jgi:hypothetical protein
MGEGVCHRRGNIHDRLCWLNGSLAVEKVSMSIYLIVFFSAGFLVLWYTAHRVMQSDGDAGGRANAFSSLKKVTIALLIILAFVAMLLLAGAAVWFTVGFFFPGVSDEWRREMATAAAMLVFFMIFGVRKAPSSVKGEAGIKK